MFKRERQTEGDLNLQLSAAPSAYDPHLTTQPTTVLFVCLFLLLFFLTQQLHLLQED